jgi:hypothetical protein
VARASAVTKVLMACDVHTFGTSHALGITESGAAEDRWPGKKKLLKIAAINNQLAVWEELK